MTTRQFFCEIRILQASSGLEPVKPKLNSFVLLRIFAVQLWRFVAPLFVQQIHKKSNKCRLCYSLWSLPLKRRLMVYLGPEAHCIAMPHTDESNIWEGWFVNEYGVKVSRLGLMTSCVGLYGDCILRRSTVTFAEKQRKNILLLYRLISTVFFPIFNAWLVAGQCFVFV